MICRICNKRQLQNSYLCNCSGISISMHIPLTHEKIIKLIISLSEQQKNSISDSFIRRNFLDLLSLFRSMTLVYHLWHWYLSFQTLRGLKSYNDYTYTLSFPQTQRFSRNNSALIYPPHLADCLRTLELLPSRWQVPLELFCRTNGCSSCFFGQTCGGQHDTMMVALHCKCRQYHVILISLCTNQHYLTYWQYQS